MPVVVPVAAVSVVAVAVVALLAVYGTIMFGRWLAAMVAGTPWVGNWIASGIERLAAGAANVILSLVNAAVGGLLDLWHTIANVFEGFVLQAVKTAEHTMASVQWVTGTFLPFVESNLRNYTNVAVGQVEGFITGTLWPAVVSAYDGLRSVVAEIYDTVTGQQAQIASVQAQVNTKAGRDELAATDQVVGQVQSQVHRAYDDLASQQSEISALGAQVGAIPGYVDGRAQGAVTAAEGYTDAAVAVLASQVAASLTSVAGVAAAAETFVKDCGEPMCDWWHTNGSGLSDLLSALELAALGALVAEAVTHPAETAAVVRDGLGAVEDLAAPFLSLVGMSPPAG